jgi:hypothetical protein
MRKHLFLLILLIYCISPGYSQQKEAARPVVSRPVYFDISPPLRDMVKLPSGKVDNSWKDGVVNNYFAPYDSPDMNPAAPGYRDPVLQEIFGSILTDTSIVNFDGVNSSGYVPPDTYGEVGMNHYFQVTNVSYAIYNKTGGKIMGPVANSSIWQGMPNNSNDGDAVVLYDEQADRWFFTQFSLPTSFQPPCYIMIAVSQTPDPTGSWYRYQFSLSSMPDYPKFGVWPDGYYMSSNRFGSGGGYQGPGVAAFDRTAMLAGDPNAQMVAINPSAEGFVTMMPSDCDGTFPSIGTPNYFVYVKMSGSQHLRINEFHVDWNNPSSSTFGNSIDLPVASFTTLSGGIPQKGSSRYLETLGDRLMYRLQYRKFNGYSAMVVNHSVNAGSGFAGVRWYQLKNSGSGWSIYQQATYAPTDNNYRWCGSMAMDTAESIALGYSVSSPNIYPQIRYTGRFKNDPLGTMTVTERHIVDGGGSQTGIWSGRSRWGDYSGMSVDPANPTTFWYTQEYYATTSDGNWDTRVGAFTFGNIFSVIVTATPPGVCVGGSSQLNALAYGGSGTYTYSWTSIPAGFTSNLQNPTVTPGQTTQYISSVSDGSQTKHDTITVNVYLHPTAFAGNDTMVCRQLNTMTNYGEATSYRQVAWGTGGDGSFDHTDSLTTHYTFGTHDKAVGGVDLYFLAMPISPCTGNAQSSKHVTLGWCTGITPNQDETFKVSVYPNPTTGNFLLTVTGLGNENASITLTDTHGQTVSSETASGVKTYARKIDLSGYPKGVYILKVQTDNHLATEKVVIQ